MRRYIELIGGKFCLCPVERVPELHRSRVLTYIYEVHSLHHGDLYKGDISRVGITKVGEYYDFSKDPLIPLGRKIGVIEEPIYYK